MQPSTLDLSGVSHNPAAMIGLLRALPFIAAAASGSVDFEGVALEKDDIAALDARKPVVRVDRDTSGRGAAASIIGVIDIAASPEIVWEIMRDCARAPKIVPHLKSCRVLEASDSGSYDLREHIVSYTFLFPRIRNVFRSDYRPYEEIRFARVDGDLQVMEGMWSLAGTSAGGTRVSYQSRLAIGVPAPRFLIRAGLREDIRDILKALREEAEHESNRD